VQHDLHQLAALVKDLIDAVEYDVNGHQGRGGNGGLTSNETINAAYRCSARLNRLRKEGKIE